MKILIADDESIIRLGLKSMLHGLGHEVLAAANGREALEMARRHQPDMAILDINMPFTNGLKAAKTLAQTQPLPIILLTAYSDAELVETATNLPIHGYLIKPIQPEELNAAMTVARKRFAESQALAQQARQLALSLEERKLIDRAKGKLIDSGISEEDAYRHLQQLARDQRISMAELAQSILTT